MKKFKFLLLNIAIVAFALSACNKDDDNITKIPVITNFSVGTEVGNGLEIMQGGLVSFTFDVEMQSDDRLVSYHVEMHNEPESGMVEDEYKVIDETFEIDNLRNTHIHEHFGVPEDAPIGTYHFHVTATSKEGYETTIDQELSVITNPNVPAISNFIIEDTEGNETTSFTKGDVIVIKFTAEAKDGFTLDHYVLEIHDEPTSGNIDDEFKQVDDEFEIDTEGTSFKGETIADVVHKITINEIGEAGKNHFHLHIYDNQNNGIALADEITIE